MLQPDFDYLRRIEERTGGAALFSEKKFLDAEALFFSVVDALGGTVDFDKADMREVHAIAALGTDVRGKSILDIGCGSTESYVLQDTFRDRYPPFFAEMLVRLGANVTGTDIRPNPTAGYDHRVLDSTKGDWTKSLAPPYDIIACLSLFNAPESPFEHDAPLCDSFFDQLRGLLASDGLLIITLRDDFFTDGVSSEQTEKRMKAYVSTKKFVLIHAQGNCLWLQRENML